MKNKPIRYGLTFCIGINKATIEKAKSEIKNAKRGLWRLTQVFNQDGSLAQNAGYSNTDQPIQRNEKNVAPL